MKTLAAIMLVGSLLGVSLPAMVHVICDDKGYELNTCEILIANIVQTDPNVEVTVEYYPDPRYVNAGRGRNAEWSGAVSQVSAQVQYEKYPKIFKPGDKFIFRDTKTDEISVLQATLLDCEQLTISTCTNEIERKRVRVPFNSGYLIRLNGLVPELVEVTLTQD